MAIKHRGSRFKQEGGSISVLTMGLFLLTVALLILITDIASIALAKRSLVHITEAAAMRAVHSLDLAAYYRGNTGVEIPLDCARARQSVNEELAQVLQEGRDLIRPELGSIEVTDFYCAGNLVRLTTSARATLPFRIPDSSLINVEIHASVGAQSDRKR